MVSGIGPFFPQYSEKITQVKDTLAKVSEIVINVEAFGTVLGTPGPDKLRAAVPLVMQVILSSDMLVTKKIDNPTLFAAGAEKITSGMADILNSLKDDIKVDNVT